MREKKEDNDSNGQDSNSLGDILSTQKESSIEEQNMHKLEQGLSNIPEESFQFLIENMMDGFSYHKMVYDCEGKPADYVFLKINSVFEEQTGLKRENIIGKSVLEVLPNTESYWIEVYGRVALTGVPEKFENYSQELCKWYAVSVYSPLINHFAVISRDITDRKKAQETILKINLELENKVIERTNQLQEINTLLEKEIIEKIRVENELSKERVFTDALFNSVPGMIYLYDDKNKLVRWNKKHEEMTGYSTEELAHMDLLDWYKEDKRSLSAVMEGIKMANQNGFGDAEVNLQKKDGTKVSMYFTACPIVIDGGQYFAGIGIDITERKLAEAVLQSKTAFLEAQTNASLDGILVVSHKQTRILTNHRIFELFNVPQHIIDDEDDTLLLKHIASLTKNPEQYLKKVKYLYDHRNETSREEIEFTSGMVLDRHSAPVIDKEGKYYGRIWTFHDITDRKRLETALEKEKNLLETTLISVGDGVISTDNKGNIVFLNRVAELLTGWTQEVAREKSIEEVFNVVNEFTRRKSENIVKQVTESGKILEIANYAILISKDGIERPIEHSVAPIVQEDGEIVGAVLVFRDFSEKKQKQEEIIYLSYHDKLTGLYNRRFYEEEIKRLDTERNLPISIIIGDVNGLKLINDAFGHDKGDELLQKAAAAIRSACRTDDIVARWGGDEFVILLPKTDSDEAEKIVKRIKDLYSNEYVNSIRVSISFGWDTKRNPDEDILKVLKSTEDYMYKHKFIENEGMRGNTISTIISTLHEKNPREEQHSRRVSEICQNIGRAMGFSEIEISRLKVIGLLHDIGKIAIEEGILNKPGKLTEQERDEIQRHPDIGYRILNSSHDLLEIANCILAHHERWDGTGYPKGLKGEAIPTIARIIAIADSYDAMTGERPYRNALSAEEALIEIRNNAGIQFDPEITKKFVEKVLGKPW